MDRQEALALLTTELDKYRGLTYDQLVERVGDEDFPDVVGPSGVQYQLEIQVVWDDQPGGTVRVLGSIDDGGWRAFVPLCDSVLKSAGDEDDR